MIATVTCNPSLDYHMRLTGALKVGTLNRADETTIRVGGKGINVTQVLTNLGVPNMAYGFVAGKTGQMLCSMIEEAGLPFTPIPVGRGSTRINAKIHGLRETEINGDGPTIGQSEVSMLVEKLAALQKGDTVVLSGSLSPGLSPSWYGALLEELTGKGIRFVVDATGQSLTGTLCCRPFLIKPNAKELGDLFDVEIKTVEDAAHYGKRLVEMGARYVLVSRGGDGAVLVGPKGDYWSSSAPQGMVVDTIGSGDSMVAGFLYGFAHGKEAEVEALRWGTACGSASAFCDHLAGRSEIEAVLGRVRVTRW